MTSGSTLTRLKSQRPEWAPWLAVVEAALSDAGDRAWKAAVPGASQQALDTMPRLAGSTVAVDARAVRNLLRRLLAVASHGSTPQMGTLRALLDAEPDALSLFRASLCHDTVTTATAAASCGADVGAVEAVVALLSVPFLQACREQWAPVMSASWQEGYCRVCGSWPAFAEVRGIERSRAYRCGRCGDEWHARPLRCPYCDQDDHQALASLVPEHGGGTNAVIDACKSCNGYVKTFTRLQGCLPAVVLLDDLASVHLDVAAIEQGYTRRPNPGCRFDVTITAGGA